METKNKKYNSDNSDTLKLLSKLEEWNFKYALDTIDTFCKDSPLYYKKLIDNKYFIFVHANSKHKNNDVFDCYIATYKFEKHIGNNKPLEIEKICLSFHYDSDFELINKHINV